MTMTRMFLLILSLLPTLNYTSSSLSTEMSSSRLHPLTGRTWPEDDLSKILMTSQDERTTTTSPSLVITRRTRFDDDDEEVVARRKDNNNFTSYPLRETRHQHEGTEYSLTSSSSHVSSFLLSRKDASKDDERRGDDGDNDDDDDDRSQDRMSRQMTSWTVLPVMERISALRSILRSILTFVGRSEWPASDPPSSSLLPPSPSSSLSSPAIMSRGHYLVRLFSKLLQVMPFTEFVGNVREGISSRTSCLTCNILGNIFTSRLFSTEMIAFATRSVCVMFRLQSPRVCYGIVESFRTVVDFVRLNSPLKPSEMCGLFLGIRCALNSRNSPNLVWTIDIPDRMTDNHVSNGRIRMRRMTNDFKINERLDNSSNSFSSIQTDWNDDEEVKTSRTGSRMMVEWKETPPSRTSYESVDREFQEWTERLKKKELSILEKIRKQEQQQQQQQQQQEEHQHKQEVRKKEVEKGNSINSIRVQSNKLRVTMKPHNSISTSTQSSRTSPPPPSTESNATRNESTLSTPSTPVIGKNLKFLQITDIHFDPYFRAGSQADCGEPVCCRTPPTSTATTSPADLVSRIAGIWGAYTECDTPYYTMENALQRIASHHPDIDVWLMTGDLPPHDIWEYNRNETLAHIKFMTWMIDQYSSGKMVLPVLGNHEAVPINSFAPANISKADHAPSWLYDFAGDQWSRWLPTDAVETFRTAGHYSVKIRPGLRVIGLNTNYCARLNFWTLYDSIDPSGQLEFLRNQLTEAEVAREAVHIVGHVPIDHRECTESWLYNYVRLMQRFGYLVKGQFFGHTHRDEFRVVYGGSSNDEPVSFQFVSPSLTSYSSTNPSYRIYEVDGKTFEIVDYQTYYFNLTESNGSPQGGKPKWTMEYRGRDVLQLDDDSKLLNRISHRDFDNILKRMKSSSEFFSDYYTRYYVKSDDMMSRWYEEGLKAQILRDHSVENPFTREGGPNSLIPT